MLKDWKPDLWDLDANTVSARQCIRFGWKRLAYFATNQGTRLLNSAKTRAIDFGLDLIYDSLENRIMNNGSNYHQTRRKALPDYFV